MLTLYEDIAHPFHSQAKEANTPYSLLNERHLQVIWLEQKLLKNLTTIQGEAIEVISPGIWNKEAGPDFLKAHLRIGQRHYRGDIEIDLHEEGWIQHGHYRDSRYNCVILHLSYRSSRHRISIHRENGQEAYVCDLQNSLTLPLDQILSAIDLDFYPGKLFFNRGYCAEHLFQSLSETQITKFFQSAAYWRLEKKINHLQLHSLTRPLQFASGIALALGYKHNAKAFLELFLYLMDYRDLPYQELLAIALGCCGFLEEERKESWEASPYYQQLRLLWWGRKSEMTHQTSLKLDHIRPLHHPVRRLAYLVHLLQDPHLEKLWPNTWREWEVEMQASVFSSKRLQQKLFTFLPLYPDEYWDYHYTFESHSQKKSLSCLGKEIKMHILLNTTLPLIYAMIKESGEVEKWEKFQAFYTSLNVSQTSKSRYLEQRFFGNQERQHFFEKAQMAQGAYQLHHDFCEHYEASCKGCPFVERYSTLFN